MVKIQIFPLCRGYSCSTLHIKNSLEIALSLTVSKIFPMFLFSAKIRWPPKYPCTTLLVKNSLKIALSLTVFKIFVIFHIYHILPGLCGTCIFDATFFICDLKIEMNFLIHVIFASFL